MQIEQGIFTSARTARSAGYQLAALSPGVHDVDARELSIWGPSHDSLCDDDATATSANFHHLPSGNYCVSRTVFSGDEYSDRGGRRVYTHCLIVPASVLASFANNPLSVLTAAMVQGALTAYQELPKDLPTIQLPGRTSDVDVRLLENLAEESGAVVVATLVRDALANRQLALRLDRNTERWVAALVNCLPIECRTQFSFSTGLKASARRPFRIIRLADNNPTAVRRIQSKHGTAVWSPELTPSEATAPLDGWPGLIAALLGRADTGQLADFLSRPRPGLTLGELHKLGNQLRTRLATRKSQSCAPQTEDAPTIGTTSVPELVQHLRRNPLNVGHWTNWVQLHDEALALRDYDRAAEMVYKACQLFGIHSKPEPQLIHRVEALLEREFDVEPECVDRSVARLQELKPIFGRDAWVQLAERIAQRLRATESQDAADNWSPPEVDRMGGPTVLKFSAPRHDATKLRGDFDGRRSFEQDDAEAIAQTAVPDHEPGASCCVAELTTIAHAPPAKSNAPGQVELLESLDDTVFAAIAGVAEAAERFETLWPRVIRQVDRKKVEESRQQYLRHALATWHECTAASDDCDPVRAAIVVKVVSRLTGH